MQGHMHAGRPSLLFIFNTPSQRGRDLVATPSYPWTSQNSVCKVPWWKCLPPAHPSICTPTKWFPSEHNLLRSGTWCLCVCSGHGTLDFLITWCRSGCHSEVWTTVASRSHLNNPASNFLSHIPSQSAMLDAMYSASSELNETDFYFLLNQETTPDPMLK